MSSILQKSTGLLAGYSEAVEYAIDRLDYDKLKHLKILMNKLEDCADTDKSISAFLNTMEEIQVVMNPVLPSNLKRGLEHNLNSIKKGSQQEI